MSLMIFKSLCCLWSCLIWVSYLLLSSAEGLEQMQSFDRGHCWQRQWSEGGLTGEKHKKIEIMTGKGLGGPHRNTPLQYAHCVPLHHLMMELLALLPTQHNFLLIQGIHTGPQGSPLHHSLNADYKWDSLFTPIKNIGQFISNLLQAQPS